MLKAEKILDKNVIRFIMKEVLNIVCMDCMWYQHDGCPALYARISRETSNNSFFIIVLPLLFCREITCNSRKGKYAHLNSCVSYISFNILINSYNGMDYFW